VKTVSEEKKASYKEFKEKGKIKSRYKKRLNALAQMIADGERKIQQLSQDELTIDGSNWEKLNAIGEEKQQLEDEILNWYIEKEQMEKEPPRD